eukprot:Blabericola_migrator_1__4124@NODE_225_length_11139_cov_51_682262_g191_i0_p5_GENE_NODE_225_length_11139_cov_51_682262_g191_i0NODE_225_length_11139_cov_51_682262_g191_i0_p5_ORF_typecomplete_len241_score26_92Peptidase_C1/PF00112_23/1e09_NODE_225_length_11139_cov_51_682262_g191_i021022824
MTLQGACGSCYAIASAYVLQKRAEIYLSRSEASTTDIPSPLSPTSLLSCSFYNQGCNGGYPFLIGKVSRCSFGVSATFPSSGPHRWESQARAVRVNIEIRTTRFFAHWIPALWAHKMKALWWIGSITGKLLFWGSQPVETLPLLVNRTPDFSARIMAMSGAALSEILRQCRNITLQVYFNGVFDGGDILHGTSSGSIRCEFVPSVSKHRTHFYRLLPLFLNIPTEFLMTCHLSIMLHVRQ